MTAPALQLSVLLTSWTTRSQTTACAAFLHRELAGVGHEVIVVGSHSTGGVAGGLDQAYRRAGGRLIMIIDRFVWLDPGALRIMIDYLATRPTVAGVSPLLRQHRGRADSEDAGFTAPYASAGCLLLHRSAVWAAVGAGPAFDEALPSSWRVTQLLVRLADAGLACRTIGAATAVQARSRVLAAVEEARS